MATERIMSILTNKWKRNAYLYPGWPKKVSHYQVPSLNRIKNRD